MESGKPLASQKPIHTRPIAGLIRYNRDSKLIYIVKAAIIEIEARNPKGN